MPILLGPGDRAQSFMFDSNYSPTELHLVAPHTSL